MGDDIEIIGETGDAKVSGLLKKLDRIEAPTDFNAQVMARLAAGRRREGGTLFWWFSRIALPITGMACFALVIWFASVPAPGDLKADVVLPETRSTSAPNIIIDEPSPYEAGNQRVANDYQKPRPKTKRVAATPEARPTSRDFAVTEGAAKTPGSNSNSSGSGFSDPFVFEIRDVLRDLGLETDDAGDRLVVRSVRANSVAERAGIQAGDRIETMDDRRITKNTRFDSKVEFTTLTVFRNGRQIVVALR